MIPLAANRLANVSTLRTRLAEVLESISGACDAAQAQSLVADLQDAQTQLERDGFKVLVMGRIKTGKSTLINAMLGQSVLPTLDLLTCTAIPISIVYGEQFEAMSVPIEGAPDPFQLPGAMEGFHDSVRISPDLAPEERKSHVHPYRSAEVRCPIDWLRHDVAMVDSPGLDEQHDRADMTWEAHGDADALIFLPDAARFEDESNRFRLEHCLKLGRDPRSIFVIWNLFSGWPLGDDPASRAKRAVAYAVSDPLGIPRHQVHFLSAASALAARISGQHHDLEQSGLPALERTLTGYLCGEVGPAKLWNPLKRAKRAADLTLQNHILKCRDACTASDKQARQMSHEVEQAHARTRDLIRKLAEDLEVCKTTLKDRLAREASLFVMKHREGGREVIGKADLSTLDAIFDRKRAAEQLAMQARDWLEERAYEWDKEHIRPLLHQYRADATRRISDANRELDHIIREIQRLAEAWDSSKEQQHPWDGARNQNPGLPFAAHVHTPMPTLATTRDGGSATGAIISGSAAVGIQAAIALSNPVGLLITAGGIVWGAFTASSALRSAVSKAFDELLENYDKTLTEKLHASADEMSAMSGSGAVDQMLAQISAIRDWSKRAQNICKQQEEQSQAQLSMLAQAEHDLLAHQITLDEIARELDRMNRSSGADHLREVKQAHEQDQVHAEFRSVITQIGSHESAIHALSLRVEEWFKSLKSDGAAAATGPGQSVTDGPTLIELETVLGRAWSQIDSVKSYFTKSGRWQRPMEYQIARAWAWCRVNIGDKAERAEPAFRIVTAIAISEGQVKFPELHDVRSRYRSDPEYRYDLKALSSRLINAEYGSRFDGDPPGEMGKAGSSFIRGYERALKAIAPNKEQPQLIWGSIIDAKWHRDRYWTES